MRHAAPDVHRGTASYTEVGRFGVACDPDHPVIQSGISFGREVLLIGRNVLFGLLGGVYNVCSFCGKGVGRAIAKGEGR